MMLVIMPSVLIKNLSPSLRDCKLNNSVVLSFVYLVLLLLLVRPIYADIINPALVEINIYKNNAINLEISLNAEAILSNSSQYKNSKKSPNSNEYDRLRALPSKAVESLFIKNLANFMPNIALVFDQVTASLKFVQLSIPEIGYQGRPRLSKLILSTTLTHQPKTLLWQYHQDYGDSAYRYQFYQQDVYNWSDWRWIRAGQHSTLVKLNQPFNHSSTNNIKSKIIEYGLIGFLHIIPNGLDHILFIIGIALLALSWQKLLTLITIFTLAHSITLALAVYGVVAISGRIVEPLIALSIAYIGLEVLLNKPNNARFIVVFFFGLLHGLGFASVLTNFNLSAQNLIVSLLSFNLGVEFGQASIFLVVISGLFGLTYLNINTKKYLINPSAALILLIGLVWTIQRVAFNLPS